MTGVSKTKAIERLQNLVDEASELDPDDGYTQAFQKWRRDVDNTFYRIFGEDSRQYSQIPDGLTITPKGLEGHLDDVTSLVESSLDEVRHFWEDDGLVAVVHEERKEIPAYNSEKVDKKFDTNRVFVIHGHDEAARETVARFLERLNLEPIILHEQPNKGRTIIEKFEDYAIVGFAVVLLTPDDVGGVVGKTDDLNPRARQNVILELGYFIGKLGRERVCPLVKGDLEKPSDYDGVVYTKLDEADGWKMKLVRELKAAGFDIDANRAVGP